MSHLLRSSAPVSDAGWRLLDEEAKERLAPALAARKLVDFSGPHGWDYPATNLGRPTSPDGGLKLTTRPPCDTLLAWLSQLWVAVLARCWVALPSFPNQRRPRRLRPQRPRRRPRLRPHPVARQATMCVRCR